jgi:hypothetical protein
MKVVAFENKIVKIVGGNGHTYLAVSEIVNLRQSHAVTTGLHFSSHK